MSNASLTHAELDRQPRKRHGAPTDCPGRMEVVWQDDDWRTLKCARCGEEWNQQSAEPLARAEHLAVRRREQSGIPPKLCGLTMAADGSERSRALRDWAAGNAEQPALMLCGDVGTGKSYMAAAALWERARLEPIRWIYVPGLFSRLALAFSDEERHEALREIAGTQTIVLDDIDKSPAKQFAGVELLAAIEMRLTAGAGVLVTTNVMPSELADRFSDSSGHAIVSRLRGHGEAFVVDGPDRRLERFAA